MSKNRNLNSCINNIQQTANRMCDMIQELGLQISTPKPKVAAEYKLVFTDASVEPNSYACRMGIYSEDQDVQISRKLTDYMAETLTIREVVKIMGKRTVKLAVIRDSLVPYRP
nr:unnamed protein product [Callosobruchus analis]